MTNPAKRKEYDLDPEELAAHLAVGTCFACNRDVTPTELSVDHDHSYCTYSCKTWSGNCVRGLLCRECNRVLGLVADDRQRLRDIIAYLDRWEKKNRASESS